MHQDQKMPLKEFISNVTSLLVPDWLMHPCVYHEWQRHDEKTLLRTWRWVRLKAALQNPQRKTYKREKEKEGATLNHC